jgi:hypothetical protein
MEIPGAVVANAVDEEAGRPRHAVVLSFGEIFLDPRQRFAAFEIALELRHVEAEIMREIAYLSFGERRLLFVQPIIHFPKAALFRRGFRSARYESRARMCSFVREMAKDVCQALTERLPQPRNHKA